jgi:hypothetical protein
MLSQAMQTLFRPIAGLLHDQKMRRLGIRNTMKLAEHYNTRLYGRDQEHRSARFSEHFQELLYENGEFDREDVRTLIDGYYLDTSLTLPHLEEMLKQVDELLEERQAYTPTAEYRAFFRNLAKPDDVQRWPGILDFCTSSQLLATVCSYLRFIPAFSKTIPPGIRVVESGKHLDKLADTPPRDSQLFHIDPYATPMLYVIVLVKDCHANSGPFTWLGEADSQKAARALDYWDRGVPYRMDDESIYSVVPPSASHRLIYPRGTVLYIDPSRCFHYGARDNDDPRYQLMVSYTSPVRSDFSEAVRKGELLPGSTGDSRLRQLVLDRRSRA